MYFPGTIYCGPFTSDFSEKPDNAVDACCRTHDLDYDTDISTIDADYKFLDCLHAIDTPSSLVISNIFKGKVLLDSLTITYSDRMLRSGKHFREADEHKGVEKYLRTDTSDSADPDIEMGDPHVGPSPTGTTMVEDGDQPVKIGDSNAIVHKSFSRLFIHNINHEHGGQDILTVKRDIVHLNLRFRMVDIPYNYLNASMTDVELETYLSVAKSFRVKSCGFQITNIVPITDERGQVQNTTVTNTTFNTRP